MSDLTSTDRVHAPLGKRGAFEGVARRHGRRRNPAWTPPRSSLRTLTNQPRHSTQRWVERCDRSVANSETPHVNNARINSARPTNLRSQPRTVSAGTPNREAIDRHLSPATLASIASPITATSSWRRNNTTSGNSTCVPKQPRYRARRGTSNRSPDRQRNTRPRRCPHGPNTPRHDGHPSSPPNNSTSTRASSAHTINIGCHLRHPESPPDDDQADGRALARSRTRQACQLPRPPGPTINCANTPTRAEIKLRSTPVGLAQTAQAQLPHATRPRRGGAATSMTSPPRAKPFVTRCAAASSRQAPAATSTWTAIIDRAAATPFPKRDHTPSNIMSPVRNQPGSWTEIRLGARAHNKHDTPPPHHPPPRFPPTRRRGERRTSRRHPAPPQARGRAQAGNFNPEGLTRADCTDKESSPRSGFPWAAPRLRFRPRACVRFNRRRRPSPRVGMRRGAAEAGACFLAHKRQ